MMYPLLALGGLAIVFTVLIITLLAYVSNEY